MPIALPLLALALLALLAWLTAAGLQATYSHTFGAAIRWIAGVLGDVQIGAFGHGVHPFRFLAHRLDSFDHFMQHAIGTIAAYNGNKVARFMLQVALLWTGVGYVVEKMAFANLQALHDLRRHTIPTMINNRLRPLTGQVGKISKTNTAIAHDTIPRLGRRTKSAEKETRDIGKRVGALAGALGAALAHSNTGALEWPIPRTGTKPRTNPGTKSRIKEIERVIGAAGVGALVWLGLRKLSLRWVRCWKVNKVGKAICGMNPTQLEGLLLGLTVIVGIQSVVEFTKDMQALQDDAIKGLELFVKELRQAQQKADQIASSVTPG